MSQAFAKTASQKPPDNKSSAAPPAAAIPLMLSEADIISALQKNEWQRIDEYYKMFRGEKYDKTFTPMAEKFRNQVYGILLNKVLTDQKLLPDDQKKYNYLNELMSHLFMFFVDPHRWFIPDRTPGDNVIWKALIDIRADCQGRVVGDFCERSLDNGVMHYRQAAYSQATDFFIRTVASKEKNEEIKVQAQLWLFQLGVKHGELVDSQRWKEELEKQWSNNEGEMLVVALKKYPILKAVFKETFVNETLDSKREDDPKTALAKSILGDADAKEDAGIPALIATKQKAAVKAATPKPTASTTAASLPANTKK